MGGVWIIWRVKGPAVAHAHSLRAETSQSVSALIHRVSAVSAYVSEQDSHAAPPERGAYADQWKRTAKRCSQRRCAA